MNERYWAPDHAVLRVLRERRDRGDRDDPYRVGLAIQGGGMRGVVPAAMLTALEDLGLSHAFDAIYGTSSGAMNGAYFYGGHLWRGLSVYWDHLTTRDFIDLRRFLTGGSALDLAYALQTVMGELMPFDAEAVLSSDVPLHVAMTLVDELRSATVSEFESREDLLSALQASSWLPLAVRGTAEFRGLRALDGFILTVHPYRFAVDDGCTHILSLSSRPIGPAGDPSSSFGIRLLAWHLNRLRPGLGAGHVRAVQQYRADRLRLRRASLVSTTAVADGAAAGPGGAVAGGAVVGGAVAGGGVVGGAVVGGAAGGPQLLDLALLPWMPKLSSLELDPGQLMLAARYAYELMVHAIEQSDLSSLQNGRFRTVSRFVLTGGTPSHGG